MDDPPFQVPHSGHAGDVVICVSKKSESVWLTPSDAPHSGHAGDVVVGQQDFRITMAHMSSGAP